LRAKQGEGVACTSLPSNRAYLLRRVFLSTKFPRPRRVVRTLSHPRSCGRTGRGSGNVCQAPRRRTQRECGMLARTVGSGGDSGWPAMIRGEPRTSWQFPTRASPTLPLSLSRSPSCYSPHRLHPPQSLCRAEAAMTGY